MIYCLSVILFCFRDFEVKLFCIRDSEVFLVHYRFDQKYIYCVKDSSSFCLAAPHRALTVTILGGVVILQYWGIGMHSRHHNTYGHIALILQETRKIKHASNLSIYVDAPTTPTTHGTFWQGGARRGGARARATQIIN